MEKRESGPRVDHDSRVRARVARARALRSRGPALSERFVAVQVALVKLPGWFGGCDTPMYRVDCSQPLAIYYHHDTAPMMAEPHVHCGIELCFVNDGVGTQIISNMRYNLKPDMLFVFDALLPHYLLLSNDQPMDVLSVHIEPKALMPSLSPQSAAELTDSINRKSKEGKYCVTLNLCEHQAMVAMVQELLRNRLDSRKNTAWLIWALHLFLASEDQVMPNRVFQANHQKLCHRILDMINSQFSRNITLDKLSDELYMSKYHILEVFREEMGFTPHEFLVNRRLSEAKRLLVTTELPIGRISELIGIRSPANFSRFFRQHVGIPPRRYRDIARQA